MATGEAITTMTTMRLTGRIRRSSVPGTSPRLARVRREGPAQQGIHLQRPSRPPRPALRLDRDPVLQPPGPPWLRPAEQGRRVAGQGRGECDHGAPVSGLCFRRRRGGGAEAGRAEWDSSASETNKGSVLSLSRTESGVKARDRAAKEKVDRAVVVAQNLNPSPNSQSSFTELLNGRGTAAAQDHQQQKSATFASHFGNSSSPTGMLQFGNAGCEHHHRAEMQQFAFLAQQHDHFFPIPAASAAASGGGDHYNLNFSISSPLADVHRGTLQSNSPSHHHLYHHHHHQSLQLDRSGVVPFLFGTAATNESHYSSGFDGHLQLCDWYKHLELKGKGKG